MIAAEPARNGCAGTSPTCAKGVRSTSHCGAPPGSLPSTAVRACARRDGWFASPRRHHALLVAATRGAVTRPSARPRKGRVGTGEQRMIDALNAGRATANRRQMHTTGVAGNGRSPAVTLHVALRHREEARHRSCAVPERAKRPSSTASRKRFRRGTRRGGERGSWRGGGDGREQEVGRGLREQVHSAFLSAVFRPRSFPVVGAAQVRPTTSRIRIRTRCARRRVRLPHRRSTR